MRDPWPPNPAGDHDAHIAPSSAPSFVRSVTFQHRDQAVKLHRCPSRRCVDPSVATSSLVPVNCPGYTVVHASGQSMFFLHLKSPPLVGLLLKYLKSESSIAARRLQPKRPNGPLASRKLVQNSTPPGAVTCAPFKRPPRRDCVRTLPRPNLVALCRAVAKDPRLVHGSLDDFAKIPSPGVLLLEEDKVQLKRRIVALKRSMEAKSRKTALTDHIGAGKHG
ncbi:hypothetical protein OF83DRAFT_1178129 [Amylostereum chailletii]|nr:hypothetical protein OF83DRAFT_1178129 [Amylostereum chailletii]